MMIRDTEALNATTGEAKMDKARKQIREMLGKGMDPKRFTRSGMPEALGVTQDEWLPLVDEVIEAADPKQIAAEADAHEHGYLTRERPTAAERDFDRALEDEDGLSIR